MDEETKAIRLIQLMEPAGGFWVGFSGGKDSVVLLDLMRRSGTRFEAHYSATTIDPPELVRFVRTFPDVVTDRPEVSFLRRLEVKGAPTRTRRWCCAEYKERGGEGRLVVTGIRAAESRTRAKRAEVENCLRGRKQFLHPLLHWSEPQIWGYIQRHGLAVCSLYAEGFKRLGCLFCLMAPTRIRRFHATRWPGVARAFRHAFNQLYARGKDREAFRAWRSGAEMWDWWLSGRSVADWSDERDEEERAIGLFTSEQLEP